ncbi:MAG: hypothetical protein CMN41_05490 [SAR116 cluster bacterium]|nr:hypothetical protein [SAR116 cluster bacterium]RPG98000.1 MAG: DUF2066 domain-containing protein [Candidatus Puniceispirillum sp. TMED176]
MRIVPFCPSSPLPLRCLCAVVLLVALLVAVPGALITRAHAFEQCPAPQFGVEAIAIDRSESTAEEAQSLGIQQAARIGFQRVLLRLLRDNAAASAFIEGHEPDQFVDFYHIAKENSLEGRYIAELDYCFQAQRLRAALRAADLQWAELISPRILVLPVWLAPDGARAWQADNAWLAGWRDAVAKADGLVDFTLLAPTIINERSLRAEDIVAADPATLRRAATVAGAEQIMLVIAQLDYVGSKQVLTVDGTLFTDKAEELTVLAKMVDRPVFDNLDLQLDYARMHILGELETGWHRANIIQGGEVREITVEVPVASLRDWAARLDAFASLAVIDSYVVRQLDMRGGLVTLNMVGSDAAISNALATRNLRLRRRDNGVGVIEPF